MRERVGGEEGGNTVVSHGAFFTAVRTLTWLPREWGVGGRERWGVGGRLSRRVSWSYSWG